MKFPVSRAFRSCSVAALATLALLAAAPARPQTTEPTFTFHITTTLIQIPVIIRSANLEYVPKINPEKITITIDHSKPFAPAHVRSEGDDPLSLAILLDPGIGENDLLPVLGKELEKAAKRSLHAQDSVAIYALNCSLQRVADFSPANPAALHAAIDQANAQIKQHGPCAKRLGLRDAIAQVAADFATAGGRRVILALSSGHDNVSNISTEKVYQSTRDLGVAVFGIAPEVAKDIDQPTTYAGFNGVMHLQSPIDTGFNELCTKTGGIARLSPADTLASSLSDFIKSLRDRFIVEFPRPADTTAGDHTILIAIPRSDAVIRAAGIAVPISDAHTLVRPGELDSDGAGSPPRK